MKTLMFLLLMCNVVFAQNQDDPNMIEFCKKTQRLKLDITVEDEQTCRLRGKTSPCKIHCGWQVISNNCTEITWRGCEAISNFFVIATPTPIRTPVPTDTPNPCVAKKPGYCWHSYARLNSNGSCFSSCYCITNTNPDLCAK